MKIVKRIVTDYPYPTVNHAAAQFLRELDHAYKAGFLSEGSWMARRKALADKIHFIVQ